MGRCMFLDPAAGDEAVLSGGSWQSLMPLSRLQNADQADVARSSNDALTSTIINADLGEPKLVRGLALVAHNFSAAAKVRVRGSAYPDFGLIRPMAAKISASPWTDGAGSPTVTAITGPDGKTSGYTIDDNSGGDIEYRRLPLTGLVGGGNGTKEVGIWVKKGTATAFAIRVRDDTAGANRLLADITWSGTDPGTPSMTTGTFVSKAEGHDGWWYLRFTTTSVTVASTNGLDLFATAVSAGATGTTSFALPQLGPRNLVLDTNIASGTGWIDNGTPTVSVTTGPFGAQDGYLIYDNSAAIEEGRVTADCAFLSSGLKVVGVWIKKGSAVATSVLFRDFTASANRIEALITWSGTDPGTPAMTAGTFLRKREGQNGWWWLEFLTASVTATNVNRLVLFGATSTASSTGTTAYALPWVEENTVAYADRHAGYWNPAYPKAFTGPSNLFGANIDLSAWSLDGTPVVTPFQADPLGGLSAFLVADDDAGAAEWVYRAAPFLSDGEKALRVYARPGTATATQILIYDATLAVARHQITITWSAAGVPSLTTIAGAGTLSTPVSIGGGWYQIEITATGVISAHENRIYLAGGTTPSTGSTYYFEPWAEDADGFEDSELEPVEPGYTQAKPTQDMLDDGYPHHFLELLDENVSAQFWRTEIDDTENPDGYVEIGRMYLGFGWESSINFIEGAQLGLGTTSTSTRTDGGSLYHEAGVTWTEFTCTVEQLTEGEALIRAFHLQRTKSTHGDFYFIYDTEDSVHMHRRAFPATFGQLSAGTIVNLRRMGYPFKIVEAR